MYVSMPCVHSVNPPSNLCAVSSRATQALDSSPWYQGIDLRKHQVVRTLGFGGFGVVYLASVALGNGSSKEMAVKSVRIMRPTTASEEAQHKYVLYCARREEEGMKVMQGSLYALHLYGSSFNYLTEDELLVPRKSYDIYMELAEKGTLKDELVGRGGRGRRQERGTCNRFLKRFVGAGDKA